MSTQVSHPAEVHVLQILEPGHITQSNAVLSSPRLSYQPVGQLHKLSVTILAPAVPWSIPAHVRQWVAEVSQVAHLGSHASHSAAPSLSKNKAGHAQPGAILALEEVTQSIHTVDEVH